MCEKRTIRHQFALILLWGVLALALFGSAGCAGPDSGSRYPNIIIVFCDDLGYGDLSSFGHPTLHTPHVDQLAYEGQKWTSFYSAANVCTPSRAALLTGRLPIRNGMCCENPRVLFPQSAGGLPQTEITIARALKTRDYATACIGKWHLGHLPEYLPTSHGFDYYYGIPYSNDMNRVDKRWGIFSNPKKEYWEVPLMRNEDIIELPADQKTITKRYTDESLKFIRETSDRPFFLYLAHTFPHVPLFASEEFKGTSLRGVYGDVVEEIDWGVGQILAALNEEGIARDTLVIFTSDNGPWYSFSKFGGSAGLLRGSKGGTFEGGMREPAIFWWPDRIKPAVVMDMGSTLDLLPTILGLVDLSVPEDRIMDGFDLGPTLFDREPSPRNMMFFYRGEKLYAIRKGPFKAHLFTKPEYGKVELVETAHDPPLLYNVEVDPSEKYNIAEDFPEVIADLLDEVRKHQSGLVPVENQLKKIIDQD